ncbi:hypothetical protein AB0L71_02055 [Streptomyces sp. NPDC052052]|uniref:hypothetical protein n=1 Tax=Streptomyces sp. NPDC052052 TaxID=3154756 RepID=UPI0034378FBE
MDLVVAVGGDLVEQLALAAAGAGGTAIVADNETAAQFLEKLLRSRQQGSGQGVSRRDAVAGVPATPR